MLIYKIQGVEEENYMIQDMKSYEAFLITPLQLAKLIDREEVVNGAISESGKIVGCMDKDKAYYALDNALQGYSAIVVKTMAQIVENELYVRMRFYSPNGKHITKQVYDFVGKILGWKLTKAGFIFAVWEGKYTIDHIIDVINGQVEKLYYAIPNCKKIC